MRRTTGQSKNAIPLLTQALERYSRVAGPSAVEVAATGRDLGLALRDTGKPAEAKAVFTRSIGIMEKAAPDAPLHALLWNNLGNLLAAGGEFDHARDAFEKSISIYEQVKGPDAWGIAMPLLSLGDAHLKHHRFEEARARYERALAVDIATLGEESDSTAYTLGRLGDLELQAGDLVPAQEHLSRAERILVSVDPGGMNLVTVRATIGRLRLSQATALEALPLLEAALSRREKALAALHPDIAVALVDLASANLALGRAVVAHGQLERALRIQRTSLRPHHPDLVRTLTTLGLATARSKDPRAVSFLTEAVDIARRELPDNHLHRTRAEEALRDFGGRRTRPLSSVTGRSQPDSRH